MMNKVVENGHVAVLVSPGWGAGWYTWNTKQELLFDPILVELVQLKNKTQEGGFDYQDILNRIEKRAEEIEPGGYWGGIVDLLVEWVDEGVSFIVEEYDGNESLRFSKETKWITA